MTTNGEADRQLRRARVATLVSLMVTGWSTLLMPAVGLWQEPDRLTIVLAAIGVALFAAGHAAALHAVVTPWLDPTARRRVLAGFAAVAVASVPLVGPLAPGRWASWAWIGVSIIGTAPLLLGRAWAKVAILVGTVAVSAATAGITGGSVRDHVVITGGIGIGVAAVSLLQVWFWDVLLQARQGRVAQAALTALEERLRFARDVHDLLGHHLSVIALKAELAERLASVDAVRSGREAGEVRRLAASALSELRAVVHGYREVDLHDQLVATRQVLESSGVRCTLVEDGPDMPRETATVFAAVLREACTNVLRHSRAAWCTIHLVSGPSVSLTVRNDGARPRERDEHSHGLHGLADRLAEIGGTLRTGIDGTVFTLEATL